MKTVVETPLQATPPEPRLSLSLGADERPKSRVVGTLFGIALFVFAALHSLPGTDAASPFDGGVGVWLATFAWWAASAGFVLGAFGLWGFPGLRSRWQGFAILGSFLSAARIIGSRQWEFLLLPLLDFAIIGVALASQEVVIAPKRRSIVRILGIFLARVLAVAFFAYGSAVITLRPLHINWGATSAEVTGFLPGDNDLSPRNFENHVVTVNAPSEKVWAWMVQIGQDKAGFYSYEGLERAAGDDIHNIFELRPEWQDLRKGDLVRAVQPGYLWGRLGTEVGWRVLEIEPKRYFTLENWGTFWVQSTSPSQSRLGVRTRVGDVPFWAAPVEVFGFEPAHFIMEQKMLRTIKQLAETR